MLENKIALVTGSTRGIGWEIARVFAAHHATVILNGHSDQALLEKRAAELRETCGVRTLSLFGDVADPAATKIWFQTIFKEFSRLDVVVNNAGIMEDALIGMIPDELIDKLFNVNVFSTIRILQSAARLMKKQNSGSIINISSIVGVNGHEGQTVYAATKAAVLGLTKSAAKELAGNNIRVNAIAPGVIDTALTQRVPAKQMETIVHSVKMGRIGTPLDVAQTALFLASDASSYVTGQVIGVDGGLLF